MKSVFRLAFMAALVPMLAYGQSVQTFIIDPQPPEPSLEKTVDFFTSTTTPSVVMGSGAQDDGSGGGIYLYTTSSGFLSGPWVKTTIDPAGDFYERSAAFLFPGDTYPGIVASRSGQLVVYFNPMNWGGDPTQLWPAWVINPNAGCNDLHVADLDQDGLPDVVCSATSALGTKSFIAFQNNPNDWEILDDPFRVPGSSDSIGDGVDVLSIHGGPRINVVGATESGVYWFKNPKLNGGNPRHHVWKGFFVGSVGNGGATIGTGVFNRSRESIVVASYEEPFAEGLVWYEPHANPHLPWALHIVDSTYSFVHQINTGDFYGTPYFIVGEIEQACGTPEIEGYHPGIPCRVTMFLLGHGSFSPFLIYDQGTHNQSVIPYNGGLLVVGANHDVYGTLYPALQAWFLSE